MSATIPNNAVEILRDSGARSLSDNPSKDGFNAKQIKAAIERPSIILLQWLQSLETKAQSEDSGLMSAITQLRADMEAGMDEVDQRLTQLGDFVTYEFVDELPDEGQSGIIYMLPNPSGEQDLYDEYVWLDHWERMATEVDYSELATEDYVDSHHDPTKQDVLQLDSAPTQGSSKFVNSGDLYDYMNYRELNSVEVIGMANWE